MNNQQNLQIQTWWKLSENPQALISIFGSETEIPLLDRVNLKSLELDANGPVLMLRLDLPKFPPRPPARWQQYNQLQIELLFIDLTFVHLDHWSTNNLCSILISHLTISPPLLTLQIITDQGPILSAEARTFRINKLSPF